MKFFFTAYVLFATVLVTAQNADTASLDTTYWRSGALGALTFSQVNLTNWAAGGQNSAAINFNQTLFAIYNRGRAKWENSLDIAYGLIRQGTSDFDKSDDKINFVTKYGYQINTNSNKWFFSALLDFRTQFDQGFDPEDDLTLISDFMAPGYLIVGTGVDYYPNEYLSFSYVPVTGKFTFVTIQELADNGDYGVDAAVYDEDSVLVTPGKNARAELGSFFRARYAKDKFESRLELFTNYVEKFGDIDVNWQNSLVVNITKVLSTNFFTQLIYDDDIKVGADDNGDGIIDEVTEFKPRIQFKSVIGVGLTYQLGYKKEE